MTTDIAAMRRDYAARGLLEEAVLADPIAQFERWFEDACRAEIHEPNAMTLATVGADGQPSARVVLLKGLDRRGLAFFTNLESRKAGEIARQRQGGAGLLVGAAGPPGALRGHRRAGRRRGGRRLFREPAARQPDRRLGLGAEPGDRRAARRSRRRRGACEERFAAGAVPRPAFWGGLRLVPERAEFWQGRRPTGCTTGCATCAARTGRGGSSAWRPEAMAKHAPRSAGASRPGGGAPPAPDPHGALQPLLEAPALTRARVAVLPRADALARAAAAAAAARRCCSRRCASSGRTPVSRHSCGAAATTT